jgi:2-hydroxychromene-2-carboxylate isomerase
LREFFPKPPLKVLMGELILLAERRADRSRPTATARASFFFDLSCPFSYLAAERVERVLGDVEWVPAAAAVLPGRDDWAKAASIRAHAETCAVALRLPLVWPERFPADSPGALRAAVYAAEIGAGPTFALAASRLAFCGGYDLEDPRILAEAAAASGVGVDACLAAAADPERDASLYATARGLLSRGVRQLPAISIGPHLFHGESALAAAATIMRSRAVADGPLVS